MKIAVVAANGRVAQKVIKEALDRGFEVKAFGRKRLTEALRLRRSDVTMKTKPLQRIMLKRTLWILLRKILRALTL